MKNQNKVLKAFDFINSLEGQDDLNEMTDIFFNFIQDMGWSTFVLGDIVNPQISSQEQPLSLSRWPEEWQIRWFEEGYMLSDPVVLETLQRKFPFFWHEIRPHQRGIGARIMDEGQEFGLFDGLCLPIHSPYGSKANVTLAGDKACPSKEETLSLHLACMYFFSKVESLLRDPATKITPNLSDRERECLHWVAAGKSDWETGSILSISQHTARFHVSSAMEKLGAATRVQAVALAMRMGAILP